MTSQKGHDVRVRDVTYLPLLEVEQRLYTVERHVFLARQVVEQLARVRALSTNNDVVNH